MNNLNQTKVLITDDEPELTETWREIFEEEGAIVTEASNGQQAWELFQKESFDLVVSDIRMTGIQLLEKIRSMNKDFPVVLVSGYVYDGWIADQSAKTKPDRFFSKPFRPSELINACNELLTQKKAA